jgi:predicted dinucleotide-binding enzyme
MKLGIIGAGNVGGTLGKRWAAAGHEVRFGVRDTKDAKLQELLKELGPRGGAGTVADAAAFGEVVVLAVPFDALDDTAKAVGAAADGKVVLDCIEPVAMGPDLLKKGLLIGHTTSAGEEAARRLPGARIVKTLNTVGFPVMANPRFGDARAWMPYCGDDAAAKGVAARLLGDLGFEPGDAGPLANARLLEPFGMLWIYMAFTGLGPNFAFEMLRR